MVMNWSFTKKDPANGAKTTVLEWMSVLFIRHYTIPSHTLNGLSRPVSCHLQAEGALYLGASSMTVTGNLSTEHSTV